MSSTNHKSLPLITPQPNYWLTVISLAIVLLLGVIPLFMGLEVPRLIKYIQDNSYIGVSFNAEPSSDQRKQLETLLQKYPQIKQDFQWVDREQAWNTIRGDFPEMAENPLFSMILLHLKSGWDDAAFQHELTEQLKAVSIVEQVYIPPVRFDQIRSNIRLLSLGLGVFALLALAGAALLIYYTIRLSIYDKRFAIRTLELVGADWPFIQRPFVKRGIRIGMISAGMASLILAALVFFWSQQYAQAAIYLDWTGLIWSVAVICILGPFVGLVTSLVTVNRYLQGGLEELFHT